MYPYSDEEGEKDGSQERYQNSSHLCSSPSAEPSLNALQEPVESFPVPLLKLSTNMALNNNGEHEEMLPYSPNVGQTGSVQQEGVGTAKREVRKVQ